MMDEVVKDAAEEAPRPWGKISAIVGLAVIAITALFWLFGVSVTANDAQKLSEANQKKIEEKADRQDVRDGFEQINKRLDKIDNYLIQNGGRKR